MGRRFLAITLFFGLIYIFIIPPFQAPDEVHHLYRTYHVSQGNIIGQKTDDQRLGGTLPASLEIVASQFRYLRYATWETTSIDSISKYARLPLSKENTKFLDFPNVGYYAVSGYIPQALGITIGKFFNISPILLLYLTRFFNFLFWLSIIHWAIKTMPYHKLTMTFVALLPASIVFHTGVNPDAVTNSFCFLLLAYLLKLIHQREKIHAKYSLLILLSITIALNKVVYTPIILLFWLINPDKLGSKKNYFAINIGLVLFHLILLYLWYKFTSDTFIRYDDYNVKFREDKQLNPGVNPLEQLKFIVNNPREFIHILFNSYEEIFPYTLKHYVGKFGWEGNYLPELWLKTLLYSLIIIPIIDNKEKITTGIKNRLLLITVGVGIALAFSIVIYMQWNRPGHHQITALSGRYFIPIFPLFLLALYQQKIKINYKYLSYIVLALIITVNCVCVYSILERYYY